MPIENIIVKRGGIEKATEVGVDSTGKTRVNQETVLDVAPYDQKQVEAPLRIIIEFDPNLTGEAISILTTWGMGLRSNSGLVIPETIRRNDMLTSPENLAGFGLQMGESIIKSALNGKVEEMDGFHGKKVFNPITKALLTYTPAQENEPPTA